MHVTEDAALRKMMGLPADMIVGQGRVGFTAQGMINGYHRYVVAGCLLVPEQIEIVAGETYGMVQGSIAISPSRKWTTTQGGLGAEGICRSLDDIGGEGVWVKVL